MSVRKPEREWDHVYVLSPDKKRLRLLVALRRITSDGLDWYEVSGEPWADDTGQVQP